MAEMSDNDESVKRKAMSQVRATLDKFTGRERSSTLETQNSDDISTLVSDLEDSNFSRGFMGKPTDISKAVFSNSGLSNGDSVRRLPNKDDDQETEIATLSSGNISLWNSLRLSLDSKRSAISSKIGNKFEDEFSLVDGSNSPKSGEEEDPEIREHFLEKVMEKLFLRSFLKEELISENAAQQDDRPDLSLTLTTSNLMNLSARAGSFFNFHYSIIQIFKWKDQTKTIASLMGFTYLCLFPHLLFVCPLLYLLFGVMIPAFNYRTPIQNCFIPASFYVNKNEVLRIYGNEDNFGLMTESPSKQAKDKDPVFPLPIADLVTLTDKQAASVRSALELNKSYKTKRDLSKKLLRYNIEVLINMKHLQNLTSDIIKIYNRFENFVYGPVGFSNERQSTLLFLMILPVTCILLFYGYLIPWRFLTLTLGWLFMLSRHPHLKSRVKKFNTSYVEPNEQEFENLLTKVQNTDILVDEVPVVEQVEVFQLQRQGATPRTWKQELFSPIVYHQESKCRQREAYPPGSKRITDIVPPPGWEYLDTAWDVDSDSVKWVTERNVKGVVLSNSTSSTPDTEGWVYDFSNGEIGEWRRRRLMRFCYRRKRRPLGATRGQES